ncbi:trypsin-like peptidase domain-containing protein [Mesorhizobium sp. LSHC412B00]|uniref:trypsin-like peptidase domain-containing protein n=1 Tax=Mesorhizobium sp. LSHC412B00 TaxID=1287285 RepID=UPI0018DB8B89|nr:trypsin-like peptidase domain-containing protein [Mesorhizobium sp. LSHC412B00]
MLVEPAGLRDQVDELIEIADEEGWLSDLIREAEEASANARIRNLRADLALVQDLPSLRGDSLERTVSKAAGFANFESWLRKITERSGWVCRIEDPRDSRKALGTGFLVGPDLVLTNYHVVMDYLPGPDGRAPKSDTSQLACRFDFSTEQPQLDGTVVPVVTESPFLSFARFSRFDPGDRGGLPTPEEADYALLRISERIGEEGKRKWSPLSNMVPRPAPPDTLIILQHPQGSPLKLAIGTVLQINQNETRLRYSTNTEGGSSGSPCFNFSLELVALHHGGDPDRSRDAEFNQGVPVEWIVDHIRKNPTLDRAVKTTLFAQLPVDPPPDLEENKPPPPTGPPQSSPTTPPISPTRPVDWKRLVLAVLGAAGLAVAVYVWMTWKTTLYVTVLAEDGFTPVAHARVTALSPRPSGPDENLAEQVTDGDGTAALRVAEKSFYIRVAYKEAGAAVTCLRGFNADVDHSSVRFSTRDVACTEIGRALVGPVIPIPRWLEIAEGELGVGESPSGSNPRIEEYHASTALGQQGRQSQSVPWGCSFVSWVLQEADIQGNPHSARCIDYSNFGKALTEPSPGAITVLRRNPAAPEAISAVAGFLYTANNTTVTLIVGNIDDRVSLISFSKDLVLDYRWPASACSMKSVRTNIEWLRTNNAGAYDRVVNGCHMLNKGFGSGSSVLISNYKDGQSHDQNAAKEIDACDDAELAQICSAY